MVLRRPVAGSPASKATAHVDYAKALTEALHEPDPRRRSINFGRLLSTWLTEDQQRQSHLCSRCHTCPQFDEALFIVLPDLARTEPERAVELAHLLVTEHDAAGL